MKNVYLIIVCFLSLYGQSQTTYIHAGHMIDTENEILTGSKTIIIVDDRITDIQDGYVSPRPPSTSIDLKEYTIMPGLMDMHVHIDHESNPKRYEEGFKLNDADAALKATQYCSKTLMAGFTFVRDLGGAGGVNVSLKKAINNGYIIGPRIITTEKSIATTGGHADPTNGVRKELMGNPGPAEGVANGPDEMRKAVRQRYKNGADMIKITATGGVLSVAKDGSGPQFTMEELKALIETASDYGMHTAAHAHGAKGMKRAVLAGINSIEHGTYMTEEIMDLMIERGTFLVPTLAAGKFVAEKALIPNFYPAVVVPKALEIGPVIQETFRKAYERGVKIAFGTDTGVAYHGQNAKEFIYMTEVGMSPMEAIVSATKSASELARWTDDLGSITPGKFADIVAVKGNPLENIELLLDIPFVMKGGVIYKN